MMPTDVELFWGDYVVCESNFATAQDLQSFIRARLDNMPKASDFMMHYCDRSGQVILDYGCGPGIDISGFLSVSTPRRVIGLDVSDKALCLAKHNINLVLSKETECNIAKVNDANPVLPLEDDSIDFINCNGVLQHISFDREIIKEFYRVMKHGGSGKIMVYIKDSILYHLFVPYEKQILNGKFIGESTDAAFSKSTDQETTPIARSYIPEEFVALCAEAGFNATFVGGHHTRPELESMRKHLKTAKEDRRLGREHKYFLEALTFDEFGFPYYRGKSAGYAGVFSLSKP